jgi:RNA polymerase sigma factor (sigma-70 family)
MPELTLAREGKGGSRPTLRRWRRGGSDADELVVAMVRQHAESMIRLARSVSICDDDANDAYQRALEILVRNATRIDPAKAPAWLRTVTKHEAMAIRAQRQGAVDHETIDLDGQPADHLPSPDDQVISFERVARSAEALRDLKPDEVRALWLRAEGFSYGQIADRCQWSERKVNRLLAEGRARFLARYARIESGEACAGWATLLSAIVDGESDADGRREAGAHLRSCGACRGTLRELRTARPALHAALPAGVAVVGVGSRGDGSGVVRSLESLFFGLHDRAAATVVKAQVAVDALSAGKVAAITASVAAVAGGGVAAVEHGADLRRAAVGQETVRPARVTATVPPNRQSTLPGSPAPATGVAPTLAPAAEPKRPQPVRTTHTATRRRPRHRTEFRSSGDEFAASRTAAAAEPPATVSNEEFSSPKESSPSSSGAGGEFGSDSGAAPSDPTTKAQPQGEFAP